MKKDFAEIQFSFFAGDLHQDILLFSTSLLMLNTAAVVGYGCQNGYTPFPVITHIRDYATNGKVS